MTDFSIRYALVYANRIQNRLVRNSNYSTSHVSLNNWCQVPHKPATRKHKFFAALTENVKRKGFRNPIIVYALPEGLLLSFGGSRLRVAHQLDMMIPCIVVDYTGEFDTYTEVTPSNWQRCFRDVPEYFEFTDDGIDTHYSLERNRRNTYDPKGMAWAEPDADFIELEFGWIDRE